MMRRASWAAVARTSTSFTGTRRPVSAPSSRRTRGRRSPKAMKSLASRCRTPRADRNTSKTVNCYSPEGLSWGKMNEHSWHVMHERTQRGEYVRNTNTQCPGWPYQILAVEPPASPTASPPGSAHDGADDEPPVHRRRTSVAAEPPDAIIAGIVLTPGPEASSSSVAGMPRRLPPPPPQRPVVILTLGVTLVHRWFNQGQGLRPPRCACVVRARRALSWRWPWPRHQRAGP